MSDALLVANQVIKRVPSAPRPTPAIAGVDLEVHGGEIVAVIGPSAVGKTVLLSLLAGWERPDSGSIRWSQSTYPPDWRHLRVVPQSFALLDELTVEENILFASKFATGDAPEHDPEDVDHLLARMKLSHLRGRGVTEISVGERQRTMVARAIVGRPLLVLADEPTAHQDESNARVVLDTLRDSVKRGAGCVLASRDPCLADEADRTLWFR